MSLSWLMINLLSSALLPPLNGLLLAVGGVLLWRRRPRLARFLVITGVLLLTALSLGVVARALLVPLEAKYPPLDPAALERLDAQAIVVLGAGRYLGGPEFAEDDVIGPALDRLLASESAYLLHVAISEEENVWPLVPPGVANHKMMEQRP